MCAFSLQAGQAEFYLGTYTDKQPDRGIFRGTLDTETGELGELTLAAEADNPSYVAVSPDGCFAYAAMEAGQASVGAFQRNEDGSLTMLNTQPSGGGGACHVSTDPSGKVVFVANYGSGDIASFPVLEDGSLGEQASFVAFEGSGPNQGRQKSPHAHAVVTSPDGRHLYACDLGTDKVWIFEVDTESAEITPAEVPFATITPGGGPRHIVFSADGTRAWVNHEMGLAATAFSRDAKTGTLTEIATASTQLEPEADHKGVTTAAILLHPSEKFLYVTSRGDETVAVFALADDGGLELVQVAPAEVNKPRGAAIDPTGRWFLVAGQDDETLTVLSIDLDSGKLSPIGHSVVVPKAVCVTFSPAH